MRSLVPGTPAEEKALAAEHRIALVRLLVILFNVAVYYSLLPDGLGVPWLAATISAIALTYGIVVVVFKPYRWLPVLRAALFTAATDGVLIVLWVWASGGFQSPFHLLWLLSLLAVAFRYEWRATVLATVLYITSYVLLLLGLDQLTGNGTEVLVRCVYIALAGTLGALLAYDSAQVFEARHRLEADILEERRSNETREVERLRELDRFKSSFINSAAHELNTPLTPLRLQIHLLEQNPDDAGRKRSVAVLRRASDRLFALVQDMLDVARLQSGRLAVRRERVDLVPLVQAAIDAYRDAAARKGIRVETEGPSVLWAVVDGQRIAQVLDNLLSNAIKFTPDGGAVHVAWAPEGTDLRLTVRDQGIGFDEVQAAAMFLPFSRPHAEHLPVAGSGLGLFISRGLAERHGGRLEAASDGPGLGATFTLVLPIESQP